MYCLWDTDNTLPLMLYSFYPYKTKNQSISSITNELPFVHLKVHNGLATMEVNKDAFQFGITEVPFFVEATNMPSLS